MNGLRQEEGRQDKGETVRHEAIDLYLHGLKPTEICRALGRSRSWFYQVLDRYRQGGRAGLQSQSRAPHVVHNRTKQEVEAAIVRIRQTIANGQDPELRYANLGADSIAAELKRLKLKPPHRATINRILGRYDLVQPRPRKNKRTKLPADYPWPKVEQANVLHQVDFVSRRIGGSGDSFYGCHLLDLGRQWPYLRIIATKSTKNVAQFLVSAWQTVGLPTALQIDNDIVWNGGGRGQRILSRIVRLSLAVGVEVIFIPPYTPKANGPIESFNDLWDSNFWGRTEFGDVDHVETELPLFETYCRHRRPLPEFEGSSADQIQPDFKPFLLPPDFDLHQQQRIAIRTGFVHFIRFVSATGTFSILNETWSLDQKRWADITIRATIDTQAQQLNIYHHPPKADYCQLIAQFDYPLTEDVVPLDPAYTRTQPSIWPVVRLFNC
ncbi:MAG TPA: helix-turn-helix domain-containing protein [Anaerolineae bacterium]|nr:helix-turn-helix domain-containing protein [Anaerolineae bacterium]HXW00141.1 helix-turn-helix domain-containing protein [Anaerolineae bacterium]